MFPFRPVVPWIRRFFPLLSLCLFLPAAVSAAVNTLIRVDQVGYMPQENPKLSMIVGSGGNLTFHLVEHASGVTVFTGTSSAAVTDLDSNDMISTADFGSVISSGTYHLNVPGLGTSYPFNISRTAFSNAWYLAMRSFYGQRCGTAVDMGTVDGVHYHHALCHAAAPCNDLPSAYHSSSGKTGTRDTPKGWHDAGDYGKYVVNSGISTAEILWTYEWFQDRVENVNLNIPETGNGIPDILDEARWNLEWMLTMQDDDGGVWHKNTSAGFGAFSLPEWDTAGTRYVIGTGSGTPYKTSCSTGDFAAVMAIAARLYQPYDPTFAATCLSSAVSAWGWLQIYPNVTYSQPSGISTGGYQDGNCSDERLWAAAELFHTTGETAYSVYVLANVGAGTLFGNTSVQGWPDVRNMALWTYYFSEQPTADVTLNGRIFNDTLSAAGAIANRTALSSNGYRVSLTSSQYYWGSNGVVANYGVYLLAADRMFPNATYLNAALSNLHYLLGRNALNVCFVTHLGSNPMMRPHHRPSGSPEFVGGAPWPGLLSGGPNSSSNDGSSLNYLPSYPPAKRWVDETASAASNENAINWNSALVLLLAGTLPGTSCGTATCTPTETDTATHTQTPTPSLTFTPTGTWFTSTPTPTVTPLETWGVDPIGTPLVYPNPVSMAGPVSLRVELREGPASVRICLYTLSYRKVFERTIPDLPAGYHYLPMEMIDDKRRPLANGLYQVVVESRGQRACGKVLVLK